MARKFNLSIFQRLIMKKGHNGKGNSGKEYVSLYETVDLSIGAGGGVTDLPSRAVSKRTKEDEDLDTFRELAENVDNDERQLSPGVKPAGESIRAIFKWLFTSRMFPTVVSQLFLRRLLRSHEYDRLDEEFQDTRSAINKTSEMTFGNGEGKFSGIRNLIGFYLLKALGPDGYNPETGMLTCADGTTQEFTSEDITLTSFLLRLFALPSRPMTLDKYGKPQYSIWQVLYSLAGTSWNPLKETITGEVVVIDRGEYGIPVREKLTGLRRLWRPLEGEEVSFYQRRWTEKKVFLVVLAVIRVPLFVVFNLVTWPFRFLRNLLKMVTEVLLPVISYGMIKLSEAFGALTEFVADSAVQKGVSRLHLFWQIPVLIQMVALIAGVILAQYAISWACRIGLAFSSPLTSALLAYNSGVLILGDENSTHLFSRIIGALGFVLSMALSATVWAIAFPLALGALVTAVPALLTPITALSQSPFIATVLAWLTQLPFVASVSTAFGTAFGVVGGALTATFGAAIGYLGSLVGVAIPQVVMAFSLIMSVIVMPALTLVTWGVEALSNLIMQWVEQRPFYTLFTRGRDKEGAGQTYNDAPEKVYVHQDHRGGDYVVSTKACDIVRVLKLRSEEVDQYANILEVSKWDQVDQIWSKTKRDEGHFNQRSRFARPVEWNAEDPVLFKGVERPVEVSLYQVK
jgi:hypothetical protein